MKCNATPRDNEKNTKYQRTKNNDHEGKNNEAQGPCQKDSVSLSLLHPKLFRCTTNIEVFIHIRVISNSKIGIKVERL